MVRNAGMMCVVRHVHKYESRDGNNGCLFLVGNFRDVVVSNVFQSYTQRVEENVFRQAKLLT